MVLICMLPFCTSLKQLCFCVSMVDTNILNHRDTKPETKRRLVYSPAFVDYLLIPFKSNLHSKRDHAGSGSNR